MATATTKPAKTPVALAERVKTQLTTAALKGKVSVPELEALEQHLQKLRSVLA